MRLPRKPVSLFDSLRLERATALSCSPHLLQVQVVVGGKDVNLEEGVRLTGLTLTSASLTDEGKVGKAENVVDDADDDADADGKGG